MTVGGNTFFGKKTSINFKIKNINSKFKKICVMGITLFYGEIKDLLSYAGISEADIRESLIKGDLANKIRVGDIVITSSSIDLLQFDDQQKAFIIAAGGSIGIDPGTIGTSGDGYTIASGPFATDTSLANYTDTPLYDGAVGGAGGRSGRITIFNLLANTCTETNGTLITGAAGSAAAGLTGGNGGLGASLIVSL